MLSVKAVARLLSVSPKTIYKIISKGTLKAHRVGVGRGTIRVSEDQLSEYLRECEKTTKPHQAIQLRHLSS